MNISDVRDYLAKSMAELSDSDATAESMAVTLERAKAMSQVAAAYTNAVRVELDAIRLADDVGFLPGCVAQPLRLDRSAPPLRIAK